MSKTERPPPLAPPDNQCEQTLAHPESGHTRVSIRPRARTRTNAAPCFRHVTIKLDDFRKEAPVYQACLQPCCVGTGVRFLPSQTTLRMTLTRARTCVVLVGHRGRGTPGQRRELFSLTHPACSPPAALPPSPRSAICFCTVCPGSIFPRVSEPSHEAPSGPGVRPFPH